MEKLGKHIKFDERCIVCDASMEVHIPSISDDRYGCPGVFSIARCPQCGQMATLPTLNESDLPSLYSQYYPRRGIDFGALLVEAKKVAQPCAGLRRWLAGTNNQGHYLALPKQRVLDIGSGSCLSLLEMREMGVEAFGVEADPNVGVIASHFGLRVHIGSIHDDPFPGMFFDLIVLNQVIEHVPDPLALLNVVKARLAPGGKVILSFPNVDSWFRRISGTRWINWHVPYHQHHFNGRSISILAAKAGYRVLGRRTITPNLWTVLQFRVMNDKPSAGRVSEIWAHSVREDVPPGIVTRIKRRLISVMTYFAGAFFVMVNRIIDTVGKGDSLVVQLQPISESLKEH